MKKFKNISHGVLSLSHKEAGGYRTPSLPCVGSVGKGGKQCLNSHMLGFAKTGHTIEHTNLNSTCSPVKCAKTNYCHVILMLSSFNLSTLKQTKEPLFSDFKSVVSHLKPYWKVTYNTKEAMEKSSKVMPNNQAPQLSRDPEAL